MMKKQILVAAAASLAVATIGYAESQSQTGQGSWSGSPSGQSQSQQDYGSSAQQAGQTQMGQQDVQNDIRMTIARITEAALSDNPNEKLADFVSRNDRDRITQNVDRQQIQPTVQAFKRDWQDKYNQSYDASRASVALSNIQVMSGDLGGQAQPAGQQQSPMPDQQHQQQYQDRSQSQMQGEQRSQMRQDDQFFGVTGQADRRTGIDQSTDSRSPSDFSGSAQIDTDSAQLSGSREGQADMGRSGTVSGSADIQTGQTSMSQNTATVVIPADPQHNLQQLTLRFVKEGTGRDAWKLDVPDHVDGQKLAQNLKNHLYVFGESKSQWPQDVNQGYQALSHHVLAALQDQAAQAGATFSPSGQSGQYQSGQQQQSGQSNQPSGGYGR